MRIALFTDAYSPTINGVATSVLMLKKNLEAMGHIILVIAPYNPRAPYIEDGIIRIPSVPFKTQRLGLFMLPKFVEKVRHFAPDIVHTHTEFTLGLLGRSIAKRIKAPHVHTMHTAWEYYTEHIIRIDVLEPAMHLAAKRYTALICNRADKVIAPTPKTYDLLRSYGVYKEVVIIPTGIELERFTESRCTPEQIRETRKDLGISERDRVLINVGRIEREKNLSELIIYLTEYLQSHQNVKLLIVGDGTAKKELEVLTVKQGLESCVIFAGEHMWDTIPRFYSAGDIFIGSSVSETQGLTYIEALASGLPLIAKRDRCLEEVLYEGENGYMYDDADSLISSIDTLLNDDEKYRRFSEKAAASAEKFSARTYADNVLGLYIELIK